MKPHFCYKWNKITTFRGHDSILLLQVKIAIARRTSTPMIGGLDGRAVSSMRKPCTNYAQSTFLSARPPSCSRWSILFSCFGTLEGVSCHRLNGIITFEGVSCNRLKWENNLRSHFFYFFWIGSVQTDEEGAFRYRVHPNSETWPRPGRG